MTTARRLRFLIVGLVFTSQLLESAAAFDDPAGDIEYDSLYPGPRNHEYLDYLNGTISENNGEIQFVIRVLDASLLNDTRDWHVSCILGGELYSEEEDVGSVNAEMILYPSGQFDSEILLERKGAAGVQGQERIPIQHRFLINQGEPSHLLFLIEPSKLLVYGDRIRGLGGSCTEAFIPGGRGTDLFQNADTTVGGGDVTLGYAPMGPVGDGDRVEGRRQGAATSSSADEATVPTLEFPFFVGVVVMLLAFVRLTRK